MLVEFFKELDRFHSFLAVSTPQQREEWTQQIRGAVVIDTDDRNSEDKDSVMPTLIYLENSGEEEDDPCESPSNPPYTEPTLEPGPPSEKPTKEPISEPDFGSLIRNFRAH